MNDASPQTINTMAQFCTSKSNFGSENSIKISTFKPSNNNLTKWGGPNEEQGDSTPPLPSFSKLGNSQEILSEPNNLDNLTISQYSSQNKLDLIEDDNNEN